MGTLYQDRGLVFATQIGTPLEATNIDKRSFKPLLVKAGLPNILFHDLRHAHALAGDQPQGRAGKVGARHDRADDRHLQPRASRHAGSGGSSLGERPVMISRPKWNGRSLDHRADDGHLLAPLAQREG